MRRHIAGALGALALACPIPAAADPLTLDILLGLETFGRVALSPSGAVAVFEERRARGDLPRYDTQPEGALRYARLYRFDPADPERVRPVLPMDDDAGYTMGPFSPDGRRLVVFRLQDLNFRIGVVDIETDAVSWMDITPETGAWGRSVQWISASEFLVLGMPRGDLPPRLADLMTTQLHLPDLWARASRGEPAFISVGRDPGEADRPVRALWRVDAASGQARLLSEGPFLDFEASPDSRHAALIVDGPLLALPDPETATQVRRARWLRLVDVRSSAVIDPAEARDISTGLLVWAPGSDAVLVTVMGTQPAKVLSISVSGAARDVTPAGVRPDADIDSHGNPTTHAGWLGETPVVRGRLGDLSGWHIQRGAETFSIPGLTGSARLAAQGERGALFIDAGRVARLHPDATLEDLGAATGLGRPDGPLGQRAQTDPMGASTLGVRVSRGRTCRVFADLGRPETCMDAVASGSTSFDAGISVGPGLEGRGANLLHLHSEHGSTVVWRLNPELDAVDVPEPHLVTGPENVRGWLYLPAAPRDRPPPVVVIPYPGATYPSPPRAMRPESVQMTLNGGLLVAAGYAVLYPDLPSNAEPSNGLANRILAVVDAAASNGLVDGDRVGLWGHSFGAWAVMLSASQSPRFGAVVALNGNYNLASALASLSPHARMSGENDHGVTGWSRWLETGQAGMSRAYWSDPERYRRASAFERAADISAPVLLFHGEMDSPSGQAEQMYAALRRLRRPATLTYLFGEDHSIHTPGNARVYYAQILDWFDRHLKSGGPRSASASGEAMPPSGRD